MKLRNLILPALLTVIGHTASAQQPGSPMITPPLPIDSHAESVASIGNNNIRLSYVRAGEGHQAIACTMQAKVDGRWQYFMSPMEDNKVFVITGPKRLKRPNYKSFYPGWTSGDSITTNPYLSGSVCEAVPVRAWNEDKNTIAVEYVTAGNHTVRGKWQLSKAGKSLDLTLEFTPSQAGCYSLGVMALHAALPTAVDNVLLPPMYQYRRLPVRPQMLLSAMMPQPLAMVETSVGGKKMTAFVSGDSSIFPLDWGGVDYSPMGFSLKNHADMVEAVAFSPVLGMADSQMKQGVSVSRKFVIGLSGQQWNETLEHVATDIYDVRDYRRQTDKSLTETMFSIIDLMNNEEFGGWDKAMRGFYDIEGKPTKAPTVVHSAPLAIISAAVNAADEDMYLSRALPTIEYTLSRKGYRWSTRTTDEGYNKDPETLRLSPFGSQFTTTYFEGLNRLLGGRNAWLRDIALPNDSLRLPRGYSAPILSWVQALYAYRLTGEDKWLRRAKSTAVRDADMHIYKNSTKPMRYQAFYNSTIYAPWWDFIDLYETTKDRRFLEAARYGAAHTLAGIRSWPAVRDSVQTIHPGGIYNGNTTMWWKGSEQYRLGFPRKEGDAPEHEVEQWKVSPVGLGFEQPSTYFLRNKGKVVRPVFMSSWAPSLLRLNQHTGLEIFDTYARNAVIGRFTNYPGYYATGYTDITMKENFPYEGPDVSSIYYHHIPPHLAFTADYLVSEAVQRSGGKVSFPYGKQEGFVWFSNRVFGGEAGTVHDDTNVHLWLKKGLVSSENPEINYLTAVSDRQLWLLLCNESRETAATTVTLSPGLAAIVDQEKAASVSANGSRKKVQADNNSLEIILSPKGFTAVSLPLTADATSKNSDLRTILGVNSVPVLKNGYKVIDSSTAAGRIYVFRIRSPFGWDSVYGFCETPPVEGLSVSVDCNGRQIGLGEYPYEWSFAKFSPSDRITMKINLADKSGKQKTLDIEI
ncbi:MAG: hypothetical protein K2H17_09175 [Duncaniella sp.]|uniref:hypothetical protein n=1 Tax=Duncaniella sp. TaxID=2518496 RepID=UPI0023D5E54A|nr:hypothetical protein [Duncaniella sp.]MDE5989557.1 hypothetical protein [Duncaniella sp.]